jgi:dolichyl-phosphate beta-glucosyltransferase
VTPHPPQPGRPRLSVVVPAYGEGQRIADTIAALRKDLADVAAGDDLEVIVVDDGSPDDTAARAADGGADRVVSFPANRGKGAAVRAGMLAATGSAVVFTDADLSYPPAQIVRLLDRIEEGWDVVVGSRRHIDTRTLVRAARVRELSGRAFNLLTRLVLIHGFGDTQCGLKGFHRDAAAELFGRSRIDGFAFDVEILWLAQHLHLAITEVPVEVANTSVSTVRLRVDVTRMLKDLVRIRRWIASRTYDGPNARPE